jgi:DNA-directed RNA polymerase specialized sigma24 family protein
MDPAPSFRPSAEQLAAIERELDEPPPAPPEPEFVNGAMRTFTGRFVSQIVPVLSDYERRSSPCDALRAVVRLRETADQLTREAVDIARAHDWPWRDIGDMLGVSASAAYRRYGRAR